MPAQAEPDAPQAPPPQPALDSFMPGGLDGARAWAGAGADAWSRNIARSSRAALAAQSLTAHYAGRMLRLNMSALPGATSAGGPVEWSRPIALGGQWLEIYVSYLRDCGEAVSAAFRDDAK